MTAIIAKRLRDPKELATVPSNLPGWYRWWANDEALQFLLGDHFDRLSSQLTKGTGGSLKGLSSVYVGVAIKESIQARLDWHINQKHSHSSVKHGTLSTLRQSIASLVGRHQGDETATNDLIDQLVVEYIAVKLPIKSSEAKKQIHQIEMNQLQDNVLLLNIQGNKRTEIQTFKKNLKAARKQGKQKFLQNPQIL
jgi:hypothetical protein